MKSFSVALLILFSSHLEAFGQVEQQWVARYDGPAGANDVAYAMTVDPSGNVYVTGTVATEVGSDCVTIKYSSAGVQQWLRTFNRGTHDIGFAIATDDLGNVYVTGSSQGYSSDYLTIKYDASGEEQWARIYEGPVFEDDSAGSVAVDAAGNVYVTGYSTGDGTNFDYATIKYSPTGEELWLQRFDVGGGEDVGAAVAVTASGIVVTGRSNYDYTTIMYDFDGVQQWVRAYDGPGNSADTAVAMKVDDGGSIYVTGMSIGVGTNYDFATVKYDPSGSELWVRRFDGPSNQPQTDYDYASSVALDLDGNVFVTGSSSDDFATVKYDPSGTELWVRRYGSAQTGDYAYAVGVDGAGNAYVTGYSYGDAVTTYDYATVSYDPSGGTRWTMRYNGPGNFYDIPHAIAVHESGDVYVTGQSGGDGTGLDLATVKYGESPAAAPEAGQTAGRGLLRLRSDPNPSASATSIRFIVPSGTGGATDHVRLSIYNVRGEEVAVLSEGSLAPGEHQCTWDGSKLSSGVYYARLRVGTASETSRLIRIE